MKRLIVALYSLLFTFGLRKGQKNVPVIHDIRLQITYGLE